jgi:hypothetical protein
LKSNLATIQKQALRGLADEGLIEVIEEGEFVRCGLTEKGSKAYTSLLETFSGFRHLFKAQSNIHGFGIFTRREIFRLEKFYDVPLDVLFHEPTPRCAFIGNRTWVSDEQVLNYVNHSCNPNSLLQIALRPSLEALRNISAGEEITVDYNLTETPGTKVKCNCQSPNCRGYFPRRE